MPARSARSARRRSRSLEQQGSPCAMAAPTSPSPAAGPRCRRALRVADGVADAQGAAPLVEQVDGEGVVVDEAADEPGWSPSSSSKSSTDITRRPRSNSVASWSVGVAATALPGRGRSGREAMSRGVESELYLRTRRRLRAGGRQRHGRTSRLPLDYAPIERNPAAAGTRSCSWTASPRSSRTGRIVGVKNVTTNEPLPLACARRAPALPFTVLPRGGGGAGGRS